MQPNVSVNLSTLDWFSLISAAASLVLAIISIWLAVHFFVKSKDAEREISDLLSKINAQTDLLQKVTNKMLDKYVTYTTQPKQADETIVLLAQMVQTSLSQGLSNNGATTDNRQIMQELTTLYIAVFYHSAVSNIYLQNMLPDSMTEIDGELSWLKTFLDRSSADFSVAQSWLSENGGAYIESSSAKQYYAEMSDGDAASLVHDTLGTNTHRASEQQAT
jgi:hypothetical protein